MAAEQEKVGAEFQALRAFLVEQEGRLLGRLEELSREVTQKQNENLAQLGDEKWGKAGWPAFCRKASNYFIILSQPLALG